MAAVRVLLASCSCIEKHIAAGLVGARRRIIQPSGSGESPFCMRENNDQFLEDRRGNPAAAGRCARRRPQSPRPSSGGIFCTQVRKLAPSMRPSRSSRHGKAAMKVAVIQWPCGKWPKKRVAVPARTSHPDSLAEDAFEEVFDRLDSLLDERSGYFSLPSYLVANLNLDTSFLGERKRQHNAVSFVCPIRHNFARFDEFPKFFGYSRLEAIAVAIVF